VIAAPSALVPFVCLGCGRSTKQSPTFHPDDRTRIFPSLCLACVKASVPWPDLPVHELAPAMIVAAGAADERSISTVRVEIAYGEFCRSHGMRPYAETTSQLRRRFS
jgi:hypothetical protein